MNKIEAYTLLFTDSLVGNLAVSFNKEFVVHSMNLLGGYDPLIMLIICNLANILAIILNYFFGKVLFNIANYTKEKIFYLRYNQLKAIFTKYYIIFLLLSTVPFFGKIIYVIAGFCNFNFLKLLLICSGLKLGYYYYILLF